MTEMPCLEFDGTRNAGGYGVLPKAVNGSRLAHRAALAEKLGRAVQGKARHTCDNPPCIEPSHLLEGTQADNVADAVVRGRTRGGRYDQTACAHGHELTPENVNLYVRPDGYTERKCRACRAIQSTEQAARRKRVRHERGLLRNRKDAA